MSNLSASAQTPAATLSTDKVAPIFSALLLGAFLIYGTGFLGVSAVHNAAHDQRHAIGFPCH